MPKVKIYTIPTCNYCKIAKEFLAKNEIQYEERDVSQDFRARGEMVSKSYQMGVPVIEVNGQVIVGFDRAELTRVLGLKFFS